MGHSLRVGEWKPAETAGTHSQGALALIGAVPGPRRFDDDPLGGPVAGSRSTLSAGRMDNALSALHLMAGRLNVGFLTQSESGSVALMLRGQYVMTTRGMSEQFDTVFSYVERRGSRQVRT